MSEDSSATLAADGAAIIAASDAALPAADETVTAPPIASPGIVIELRTIAWAAAVLLFVALRIGPTWQAGVNGAELVHLAGAWQASIGETGDTRFVSTLFQALSAIFFKGSESEVPLRVLTVVASHAIPLTLYRLRRTLGDATALVALAFIAIDPIGILYTTSASAMALDVPVALGLLVLATEPRKWHPGILAAAGFAVAVTGPIVLALAVGLVVLRLVQRAPFEKLSVLPIAAGVVAGALLSLANFGLGGFGSGIAPINLLAGSFDERWSTAKTIEVFGMYSWPLAAGGIAYGVVIVRRLNARAEVSLVLMATFAWAVASFAWMVASVAAHSPAPVLALTLPCSILAAAGLVEALSHLSNESWRGTRFALPAAVAAGLIAMTRAIDWARAANIGGFSERLQVILLLSLAIVALAYLCWQAKTRPVVALVGLVVGVLLVLPGSFGVGLSGTSEAVLSPLSTTQARQVHDRALASGTNSITVHPRLESQVTWPFRGIDTIVITSQPGPDDRFVVWPADLPPPEGFAPLEGTWLLESEATPPTLDGLVFIKWLSDRNNVAITGTSVAVYLRANQ